MPAILNALGLVLAITGVFVGLWGLREAGRQVRILKQSILEGANATKEALFDDVTKDIFDNLKKNYLLTHRMSEVHKAEKRSLGPILCGPEDELDQTNFMAALLNQVARSSGPSLFIESGSTLAYLCHALCNRPFFRALPPPVRITTNNILVDMTCVFQENISVQLLEGTPVGRYGATFGAHVPPVEPYELVRMWRTTENGKRVRGSYHGFAESDFYLGSEDQYDAMYTDVQNFFEAQDATDLIIMTASELSLQDGPHVGSFQNRDFKEILFRVAVERSIPIVLLLYDKKIETREMPRDRCLSVFGEDSLRLAPVKKVRGVGTGMVRFAREISEGKVTLVVTSMESPAANLGNDPHTNAGRLFQMLAEARARLFLENYRIGGCESADRRIRVFKAKYEAVRDMCGDARRSEYLRGLRTRLDSLGYSFTDMS